MSAKKVQVVQGEKETPVEILADCIVALSEGIQKLRSGRLKDKTLILLIQNAAPTVGGRKVTAREVSAVLEGINDLEKTYLK